MDFFTNMRSKIAEAISPSNEKGINEYRRLALGIGTGSDKKVGKYSHNAQIEKYKGWVYAAVRTISLSVSSGDLKIYKRINEKEIDEIKKHLFLELWKRPNPDFTRRFIYKLQQIYLELTGNAYWHFILNGKGEPNEIWFIPPTNIKPIRGDDNRVEKYEYRPAPGADPMPIAKKEIMHVKEPNPSAPHVGLSPVWAANVPIALMDYMDTYHERLFQRMARPDVILTTDQNLTEKAQKRIKESWEEAYGGMDNAGKAAVLEGNLDVKPFSTTPKDLEYSEGYDRVLHQIIACYGTTLAKLGITKDINKANARALELSYQRDTVMPKLKDLADWLTQFVLHRYYNDTEMYCEFDSTVPEDQEVRRKTHTGYVGSGIESPNEAREDIGLPPAEGGDERLVPMNMIGAGSAVTGQGRPEKIKISWDEDGNPIYEFDNSEEQKQEKEKPKSFALETREARLRYWKKFVGRRLMYVQQFEKKLGGIFQEITDRVVDLIRERYNKEFKGVDWLTPPDTIKQKEVEEVSKLFIKQSITNGAVNLIHDFNFPIDFTETPALTQSYMDGRINLIRDAMRHHMDDIKDILKKGIQEGLTTDEMAEHVSGKLNEMSKRRARLISRTEVNAAENRGHLMAMSKAGSETKMWVTAGDERVRDSHIEMDGEERPVSEPFSNGLMTPSEPNCRCAVVPGRE